MFAFNRDLNVVLARGVRRMFAIALEQYRARARRAVGARFLRRAAEGARAAAADGRVLAEPLPARVALSPRARRRVPGHQPRAVGAGVAAGPGVGRRPRRRDQPLDLHRRRSQAVDLPVPGRRGRRARAGGRGSSTGFVRAAGPAGRSRAASARCPSCCTSSTTCSRRCRSPTGAPGEFTYEERDRFPVAEPPADGRHRRRRRSAWPSPKRPEECAAAVADEVERSFATAPCATRRPASPGAPEPATSASCSAREPATASSSTS